MTIHAAELRMHWRVSQLGLVLRRFVFIDEAWTKTNMTWRQGRTSRGKRLMEKVPHGHGITTTLVAGLGHDGMDARTIMANSTFSQLKAYA